MSKIPSHKRRASIHDIHLPNRSAVESTNIATPATMVFLQTASVQLQRITMVNLRTVTMQLQTATIGNLQAVTIQLQTATMAILQTINLAYGSVFGPSGSNPNICTEPIMPFAGHQQFFNPSFQYSSMFNFEYGI
jgi:hypothetical protein